MVSNIYIYIFFARVPIHVVEIASFSQGVVVCSAFGCTIVKFDVVLEAFGLGSFVFHGLLHLDLFVAPKFLPLDPLSMSKQVKRKHKMLKECEIN